jgi:Zn-dependent M28 family amino/carboxypeptidase
MNNIKLSMATLFFRHSQTGLRFWMTMVGLILIAFTACNDQTVPQTATVQAEKPIPTIEPTVTRLAPSIFDGANSYQFLLDQMAFGPRWPGSPGHAAAGDYIIEQLESFEWEVAEQKFDYQGIVGRNIIGRVNDGSGPVIIVGAHYDTRKIADQTPDSIEPVPGAVDGASGVALLLELARTLDIEEVDKEIWLAFFDIEDNGSGGMPDFDWIIGSTVMANSLNISPEAMILVDMIGDADQQLYFEGNSDPDLRAELWKLAAGLGYQDSFIPEGRHTMIDDHVPFARRGIPAVDIIDFDYAYWHTVEDTADKASPESLERVGRTLETWLEGMGER